jgi:LPS-assembly lipoprotein
MRRCDLGQWPALAWPVRLAAVLAAAGLTAGCWQPLYGSRPGPGGEGVQDKFATVDIPPIAAPKGTPTERLAVSLRNALQFDLLHNGQPVSAAAAVYQLKVSVASAQFTSYVDPVTGRPDSSIENVIAAYQLVELATGKMVVNDVTYAHVSYDNPATGQQRFAGQRARRDAEDQAIQVAADAIRNRLASYFVAGT